MLRFLNWGTIGHIGGMNWRNISTMGEISSSTTTTGGTTSGGGGASGLSVVKERDVYVNFYNYGVLTGYKNEQEFISWLKTSLELAAERGL